MRRFSALLLLAAIMGNTLGSTRADPGGSLTPEQVVREATRNILPFWLTHARNPANGGFHGYVGADLKPRRGETRGSLLTSRVLWTFSAAYRHDPKPEYKEMADYAYRDLMEHFWDREHGGVFWSIKESGEPKETTKQIYTQAFAVYGLSEYARTFEHEEAKNQAITLYRLMEEHALEKTHGGYVETCARDWNRLREKGGTLMGPAADKSQNTNLHVMEAWTNLLRLWPDETLKGSQRHLLEVMMTKIVDPSSGHLHLFQKDDWTPLSHEYSYGHDIEFSWLVTEAAEVLGDHHLEAEAKKLALRIVDVTAAEGMDADGGIFHEGAGGEVTKRAKEWWPQAEAFVGFLNAYQISKDAKYLALAKRNWEFIETRQVDPEGGEWFQYVPENAASAERMPKISFWKCCYHNTRACLEGFARLKALEP